MLKLCEIKETRRQA